MSLFISKTFRGRETPSQGGALANGRVAVSDAIEARRLLAELGLNDGLDGDSGRSPSAGELASLALMEDAFQSILTVYQERRDPTLMNRILAVMRARLGIDVFDRLLTEFAEEYLGATFSGFSMMLAGAQDGRRAEFDRSGIIQNIVVFWLLHSNGAARHIVSRIHQAPLLEVPAFQEMVGLISEILEREPGREAGSGNLWVLLTRPMREHPGSLSAQLSGLREQWSSFLEGLESRLDSVLGMLAEESAPRFPPGPGPSRPPSFSDGGEEVRFSPDRDWMSSVVLVSKHVLVWLDQLSSAYGQAIERLDQIPTAELERLASFGFNGLWLIGLWERSPASRTIKHRCGNPEAVASAYSLIRYSVSEALGGEAALDDLRGRAGRVGIRLAADMVPNHTGLDSDWLFDRPDWFVSQTDCPFPAYRFGGPDLSSRAEIGLYLEDHYYDRTDAAVVLKRVDHRSGEALFVYHGNDGTSMPWNDTAQLDYLNREVWDAVIDTILDVARRFPIIRFDAAMTLTRKHFQRLWYPAPGTAGAIPSRAEHGMSQEEFLERMPQEFWRLVVDRLAAEAPDTLLLAEAFWLMEGFFVRTLGMHRVYNSAFMNMLRDGETAKFRHLIKETLVFDPGILKRYVNFMSNPDEHSAIEQFGDGERYLGTTILLATLPGLPMFGHGQVEGLSERYGMEYSRSYREESPRDDLIRHHLDEIAPLLHERGIFADVEHFRLFDCLQSGSTVDEDVLAYANGIGSQTTLILYNNSDRHANGRIDGSVPFGPDRKSVRVSEVLGLGKGNYWQCVESRSGKEFLLRGSDVLDRGLEVDLAPWESRVLRDFSPCELEDRLADQVLARIGARGTLSLAGELRKIEIEPFQQALGAVLDEELLRRLMELPGGFGRLGEEDDLLDDLRDSVSRLAEKVGAEGAESTDGLLALVTLPELARRLSSSGKEMHQLAGKGLQGAMERRPEVLPLLFSWFLLTLVMDAMVDTQPEISVADWDVKSTLQPLLVAVGGEPETVALLILVVELALESGWGRRASQAPAELAFQRQMLTDRKVRRTLGAHQFEGREYINREALEAVVDWRLLLEALAWSAGSTRPAAVPAAVSDWWRVLQRLEADAERSSYCTAELGIVYTALSPA